MIEYAETYIGDCADGDCDRAATVRIHGDWVVCTLHHEVYLSAREVDQIDLTLDFIKKWRSQARAHGLDHIQLVFDRTDDDLAEQREALRGRGDALDRVDRESVGNHGLRLQMDERAKRDAIEYPTRFTRVLSELAGYLGDDWRKFAEDMVETAGEQYGAAAWDWLYRELTDTQEKPDEWSRPNAPDGFMEAIVSALDVDERQRNKLAMAYTFGK